MGRFFQHFWFSVVAFWTNYTNFSGRTSRSRFWLTVLFLALSGWILTAIDLGVLPQFDLGSDRFGGLPLLTTVYSFVTFIPTLALFWRRMNDANKSGWWAVTPGGFAVVALVGFNDLLNSAWSPLLAITSLAAAVLTSLLLFVFTLLPSSANSMQSRNVALVVLALGAAAMFITYFALEEDSVELLQPSSRDLNGNTLAAPKAFPKDCESLVRELEEGRGVVWDYDPPFEDTGKWENIGLPANRAGLGSSIVCVHGFEATDIMRVVRLQEATPELTAEFERELLASNFSSIEIEGRPALYKATLEEDAVEEWWELYVIGERSWFYLSPSMWEGPLDPNDSYFYLLKYIF